MTTTADRSRVQPGVPTGGQFATEARTESGVTLAATTPPRDWGSVENVQVGSRTPWGAADHVTHVADGIVEVGTAGHGGIKLSPQRNREVPTALRTSSGWYEEDCEANIVMMAFPSEYADARARRGVVGDQWADAEFVEDHARSRVRNWFPDAYEKATGETIAPGESTVKDERVWLAANVDAQVAVSATMSNDHPGMVEVTTTTGARRDPDSWEAQRVYLVPKDEYAANRSRFIIDPDRHTDITPPPVVKVPMPRIHPTVDFNSLTVAGRERVRKDLGKRWRRDDGTVASLSELLATEGVTGKSAGQFDGDGKVTYYLQQTRNVGDSGGPILPVTKATWDALSGVPDSRSDRDRAALEVRRAQDALEKAGGTGPLGSWYRSAEQTRRTTAAKAKLAKAQAALDEAVARGDAQ